MMTEPATPNQLVQDVRATEEAGFDFSLSSDHYQPWLDSPGSSLRDTQGTRGPYSGRQPRRRTAFL
jgi:hypothetical protein